MRRKIITFFRKLIINIAIFYKLTHHWRHVWIYGRPRRQTCLLSTLIADRRGVDISFTVFCLFVYVFVFVRLRIAPARIKPAASNFVRWFRGVLGRESPIFGNFAPPEVQNRTNRRAAAIFAFLCVDIRTSAKTDVLVRRARVYVDL